MKKDKEWLKEELNKQIRTIDTGRFVFTDSFRSGEATGKINGIYKALELVDQLEEPEQDIDAAHDLLAEITTLSQEDFDLYWNCINDGVAVSELKQKDKVVIPQFVADFIGENFGDSCPKAIEDAVYYMDKFNECHEYDRLAKEKVFDDRFTEDLGWWISENIVLFYKACTNGYTVEKEKLYRVKLPTTSWDDESSELKEYTSFLAFDITSGETTFVNSSNGYRGYRTDLTEVEIKSIDERYWAFAEEVPNE